MGSLLLAGREGELEHLQFDLQKLQSDRNFKCIECNRVQLYELYARFQVLTAACMKIRAFWDIAPCSLIVVDHHFRGVYCLHHQGSEYIYSSLW
jgi:hypothetical protein